MKIGKNTYMLYGRLGYVYRYMPSIHPCDELWNKKGNLGDSIQSIAVEGIYERMGFKSDNVVLVNRDEIDKYCGEECLLPMNGFFGDSFGVFPFPWSKSIRPVFLGFHISRTGLTRDRFINRFVHNTITQFGPVGCRDRGTRDFLRSHGVPAYFSGCLTLTIPVRGREPAKGKVFIIDVHPEAREVIPSPLVDEADDGITSMIITFPQTPLTWEDYYIMEAAAKKVLQKLHDEARLVITSRLHAALASIALGIPVVYLPKFPWEYRIDVIHGIIPVYSHLDRGINWDPKPADISTLRILVEENAKYEIMRATDPHSTGNVENIYMKELIKYTDSLRRDLGANIYR